MTFSLVGAGFRAQRPLQFAMPLAAATKEPPPLRVEKEVTTHSAFTPLWTKRAEPHRATPIDRHELVEIDFQRRLTFAWAVFIPLPRRKPSPSCDLSIGCSFGPGPRKLELSHNSNLGETE